MLETGEERTKTVHLLQGLLLLMLLLLLEESERMTRKS
jgi:hypothetical protein